MRKLNAIFLLPALVMVSSADILELLECDPSFGDHVIPSPEYCDRLYSLNSEKIRISFTLKVCSLHPEWHQGDQDLPNQREFEHCNEQVCSGRQGLLWREN